MPSNAPFPMLTPSALGAGDYWTDFHDAEKYPLNTAFYVSAPMLTGPRVGCIWRLLTTEDRDRMTRKEQLDGWRFTPLVDISADESLSADAKR